MSFTPASNPSRGDADRRSRAPQRERAFTRRIECDENGERTAAGPARGGGLREPDAWRARGARHD